MNLRKTILLCFFTISCVMAGAHQVTDTLFSPQKDRVIVTYDITQKNSRIEIHFKDAKKKLGAANKDKYKDMAEIAVLFFDRIGSFKDITLKGMEPSLFMVPSEIEYERSEDGYFIVGQDATLAFDANSKTTLSIPMYLAHYERKGRYKVFAQCGNLDIEIGFAKPQSQKPEVEIANTFVEIEIDEAFSDTDAEALASVNYILEQLSEIDRLPFSELFVSEVESLKKLKFKVENKEVASKIQEALETFAAKKASLEALAAQEAITAQQEAAKQDSIAAEEARQQQEAATIQAEEKEKKEKKQKIWMIVGGALLAILLFVGNQVMQSLRNIKTQRSMMQMQQNAANQAKSKATSAVRKTTGQVVGQTKRKGKDMLRDSAGKIIKGKGDNKKISI